jgi:predicted RNA methylase
MKLTEDVLAVLSTAEVTETSLRITAGRLDRKVYLAVDKAVQALGGKWDRKTKTHTFPSGAASQLVENAILTGEVTLPKNDLAFFPTSPELARQLVVMAGVKKGWKVLEPSAGTGRIVDAILAAGGLPFAVERDIGMRTKLALRDPPIMVIGATISGPAVDFMDLDPRVAMNSYDAVVMNPPFKKSGKGDHLDHVRHAFNFLKPKGVLVSVLPVSIEFREDKRYREFRDWHRERNGEVVRLPEGSFKDAGTSVNTCTLRMVRR